MNQTLFPQLNQVQRRAVLHDGSPLLLIAGAGSGKTSVIINKIIHMVGNTGINAKGVFAITFSNKAAREMQLRIAQNRSQLNLRGLKILTFHALGLQILRNDAKALGYKSNFSVLDTMDCLKIISDLTKHTDKAVLHKILGQISLWKNSLVTPKQILATASLASEVDLANIFEQYQNALKTYQAVDFDDLILLPLALFKDNLDILYKWQQKISYLLVDEYQDTNLCQYNLIKLLMQRNINNLMVVGDDDQSIYAWRGATINNLIQLQADFSNLTIIKLEQNYRSTLSILNVANSLIRNNTNLFTKTLWSSLGHGELVKVCVALNEEQEATMVVKKIMLHQLATNSQFSDYCILYRSNHQSRIIEQTLRSYKIPYTISGGESFFDKAEIKDILAYLRLLINDDDDVAFMRAVNTPKRGIGQATLDKLANYAGIRELSLFAAVYEEGFLQNLAVDQIEELSNFTNFINNLQYKLKQHDISLLLNELVDGIMYKAYLFEQEPNEKNATKRWENVQTLSGWLIKKAQGDKSLLEIINNLLLSSMLGERDEQNSSSVRLSTLHAAKGLEFPYVYIINCEEGIIPHQESINNDDIEEERRLMYVGVTRAQKELTLSYASTRRMAGEIKEIIRSRFIDEIASEYLLDESVIAHQKIQDNGLLHNKLQQLKNLIS